MTTTVTVTTHDWPVEVTTTDRYTYDQTGTVGDQTVHTLTTMTETLPPRSERQIHITSSRGVSFAELPLPEATPADV